MTTLTDFRDRLNEHPEDWACLLALADFLMDTDPENPRIDGYKWLGHRRLRPWFYTNGSCWAFRWHHPIAFRANRVITTRVPENCYIPEAVFRETRSERNCTKYTTEVFARVCGHHLLRIVTDVQ